MKIATTLRFVAVACDSLASRADFSSVLTSIAGRASRIRERVPFCNTGSLNTEKPVLQAKRYCKAFLMTGLIATSSFAAEVTMTVNPPIISLGEAAQIKVEVRDAKRPQAPDFPRVDGLSFSGTGQSTQTRMTNLKVDKSVSYTINAYPQRTGEFTIGPFNYKVDGEVKRLSGSLKVVGTSGDVTDAQSWNDMAFARITSSRNRVYVQEPFELTLSIYSKSGLQIQRVENLKGIPETGLSKTEWKETSPTREQVDGVLYDVRQFKASLRAMGSGLFKFEPTVTIQVAAPRQQRHRDPFLGGFGLFDAVQTIPVELVADPATVEVLPLPPIGKPENFSGAVGRFIFEVTAEPKEVAPGDPITLQMTLIGEGNYDRILPPALPAEAPFRLFGDAVRQQGNNGVRFEQVISPQNTSVTEIPPLDFSYFDSESGQYRTVSSTPIPITVNATSNNTAQVFAAQETLTAAPADTPFATESDLQRITGWLKKQWKRIRPWLWTLPTALGAGLLLFLTRRFYHRRRKDTARMRRQQAPKAARAALKAADTALQKNDTNAFYEAAGNALNSYFGNRLNLPPGEVTPHIVLNAMEKAGLETDKAKFLFDHVEAARYGLSNSQQTAHELKTVKNDLQDLLKSIEKSKL